MSFAQFPVHGIIVLLLPTGNAGAFHLKTSAFPKY